MNTHSLIIALIVMTTASGSAGDSTPGAAGQTVNLSGKILSQGLGIQRSDPAHLAFPATVGCEFTAADLHPGNNSLTIEVKGAGWLTWHALELLTPLD
ncbi:MAG: hypothetical protein WCK77_03450 [Verrucomicrobiota bacterium]